MTAAAGPATRRAGDSRDRTWWTKARVIEGLRRLHADTGQTPLASREWQDATRGLGRAPHRRRYPSFYGVLRYFKSFRQAWAAAGIETDRSYESWTETEDWYLREGAGILSRKQLAADLGRTPDSVHRRLYDLGMHSYEARGWTLHRVERTANVARHLLDKYLERGDVPYLRGSKCVYVDPADLLVIEEIDWSTPPAELEQAIRRSLVERVVKILAGQDWRAGRLYQAKRDRRTNRVYRWGLIQPGPKPIDIEPGHQVRCVGPIDDYRRCAIGRIGLVHLVSFRRQGGAEWMARVEFKRVKGVGERVIYTLPLTTLEKVAS